MSVFSWQQVCLVAVLCGVAFDIAYLRPHRKRRTLPLPPGPQPLPIAGNIRGDLVYSRFFNQEINSAKVARALLEQRSNICSDRPEVPTNVLWQQHRRLFHEAFRADAAPTYHSTTIFEDPAAYFEHLHTYSSSIIMSALYDYETKPKNDSMVNVVGRAVKLAIQEVRPEIAAFFSVFSFLLSLSSWVPGMEIHRKAARSRAWCKEWVDTPFGDVLERMKEGTAGPSSGSDEQHVLQAIKEVSTTALGASTLQVFILAIVLFPKAQKKAQSIIDATVGTSRLPLWTDRPSLKYIDAILRETLRWSTPHVTMDSDVYEGATVMPNVWARTHDEIKYPNSFDFNPERFFKAEGNLNEDNVGCAFGFSRRICVGRHLADASLWYAISGMLALFYFSRAKDNDGNDEPQWSSGIAVDPLAFPFEATPRRSDMVTEDLNSLMLFSSS
ncbi:Cytochrome P450 [Tylopilus felleus]